MSGQTKTRDHDDANLREVINQGDEETDDAMSDEVEEESEGQYSPLEFVWGGGFVNEKNEVVVDFGDTNGYRCPVCQIDFKSKRKQVVKVHFTRSHKLLENIFIPSIKEKCQYCNKPLDPKASKRTLHLRNCLDYKKITENNNHQRGQIKEEERDEQEGPENPPDENLESMEELMNQLHHVKQKYEEELDEVTQLKDTIASQSNVEKELEGRLLAANTELNRQAEEFRVFKAQLNSNDDYEDNLRQEIKGLKIDLSDARNHEREIQNEKKVLVEKVSELTEEINEHRSNERKRATESQREKKIQDDKIADLEIKLKDALKSNKAALEACDLEQNKRRRQNHNLQTIKDLNPEEITMGDKFAFGEFGEIFKAKRGNKEMAVKRAKRIEVEAITEVIIMLKLQDVPNVMCAESILLDPTQILMEMNMMDGDLHTYIQSRKSDEETEWRRVVMKDTAKGVKYLHEKNIIHCDIKPANFLTKLDNNNLHVFLSDFGSSNIGLNAKGFVGTPGYIAPEMYISAKYQYDEKVDEWSLGATLFEVLTGEDMVSTEAEEIKPKPRWNHCKVKMPKEIEAVKMLLKIEPKKRATAAEFLKML